MEALNLPVLALRGMLLFPGMSLAVDVERPAFIGALANAMESDQKIFVTAQKEISVLSPGESDLHPVGTVASIRQCLRLSQKFVRVVLEGESRARLKRLWQMDPYYKAQVELLPASEETAESSPRMEAELRQTISLFSEYTTLNPNMPEGVRTTVAECRKPGWLADFLAQSIPMRIEDRQLILEETDELLRLHTFNEMLARELDVQKFQKETGTKIRQKMENAQKEQILRTQIHLMQEELTALGADAEDEDAQKYRERILALKLPQETEERLLEEVHRLSRQSYASSEGTVIRTWLDTCLSLPWNERTKERLQVEAVHKTLNRDHFGLTKVKERILESIAARQMNPEIRGQILCLVGPPGVGKTSIAISVAKALNRNLARLSLGGVRDEADIRGHRKTYIGAMPGRIVDAIIRCKSMNPLMLLDEVDKLGNDYRGDPSAALLEVLDSEQNHAFRDHFLEIPIDLSQVFFITTANTTDTIPRPLLDRMEIIRLGSYTDEEKLEIARRHLLPRQLKEHGLTGSQLRISDAALRILIQDYTRESGVRTLERQIARICRKADRKLLAGEGKRVTVTEKNLVDLMGPHPYPPSLYSKQEEVGIVNGLAWTEMGGTILEVEVNVMEGTGQLELTGNLGDVMKESAQAALSCLRSRAAVLNLPADFYKTRDIHVHFPEGAVPKDGPSAGIAITTAMLSALTGRRVHAGIAMTGEVTIRGRVLPIGGLREKTMAAKRHHLHTVLIPRDNVPDLEEIDQAVRAALEFVPVSSVDEVFARALCPPEQPVLDTLAASEPDRKPEPEPDPEQLQKSARAFQDLFPSAPAGVQPA